MSLLWWTIWIMYKSTKLGNCGYTFGWLDPNPGIVWSCIFHNAVICLRNMRWKTTLPFAQLIKKSIAYIYQSFCYFKSVTLNMNTMYLKTLFSFSNFNEKISVNNLKVYILFNSLPLSFQLSNYQRYSHLHHSSFALRSGMI